MPALRKADVAELLALSFPGYTGRKFRVQFADSITLHDLHWGGGSRTEYRFIRIDGAVMALDFSTISPWSHQEEGRTIDLPPHVCCAKHSVFCGKDMGVTFVFNPSANNALCQTARLALADH